MEHYHESDINGKHSEHDNHNKLLHYINQNGELVYVV
jgi:hypothetical protein